MNDDDCIRGTCKTEICHAPLVELLEKPNPFRANGVRIPVKTIASLSAQNVEALPVERSSRYVVKERPAERGLTTFAVLHVRRDVVEMSSESTITSLAVANRSASYTTTPIS